MCNIELSIDEFFPDQVTADQVNTTLTPGEIYTVDMTHCVLLDVSLMSIIFVY